MCRDLVSFGRRGVVPGAQCAGEEIDKRGPCALRQGPGLPVLAADETFDWAFDPAAVSSFPSPARKERG